MIQVYQTNREEFEFNGDMILSPISCVLKTKLNGDIDLELEHLYDEEGRWNFLVEGNLIKVPYPFKEDQLFRIYEVEKSMDSIICKARHVFFDLTDEVLLDVRPTNKDGQGALNEILAQTKFKGFSDIKTINTAYYIRKAIANEALISNDENSFINRWGGELDVDNYKIYFNERCGGDYGVSFIYGKNLIGLEATVNLDNVMTRIIPVGYDGITIPEGYVDSPLINQYPTIKSKVVQFLQIKVRSSENSDDGYETLELAQEALREACLALYEEGEDKPSINIKIEVLHLEHLLEYEGYESLLQVGIGDTVIVHHEGLGIDLKTRVISYQYDCLTQKYTAIELGDVQSDFLGQHLKTQQTIQQITTSDGSVNAEMIKGFLDAQNTKLTAQREIAQKQHVRAIIFEDLDEESPTYGCCALGTAGLEISHRRSVDGREWIFDTAVTGLGINADVIVTGTLNADLIKAGTIDASLIKTGILNADLIKAGTIDANLIKTGIFNANLIKVGAIKSYNDIVNFNLDGGFINFNHTDGTFTQAGRNGLYRYRGDSGRGYHYLTYIAEHIYTFNPTQAKNFAYTYTVPEDFQDKMFYASCSAAMIIPSKYNSISVIKNFSIWAMRSSLTQYQVSGSIEGLSMVKKGDDVLWDNGEPSQIQVKVMVILTA